MQWPKADKSNPCPKCQSSDGSCRYSPDGKLLLCLRVESGGIRHADGTLAKARKGMGTFHSLESKSSNGNGKHYRKPQKPERKLTVTECRNMISEMQAACDESRYKLGYTSLGVSIESLKAFGMGWDEKTACFAFPMHSGANKPIGIRLRSPDGTCKKTVLHSSNGIFIPANYDTLPPAFMCDSAPQLLLLPEGPTDACAAYDCGFRAIGRPSNMGGTDEIAELLKSGGVRERQDVVIISDRDGTKWSKDGFPFSPGIDGAVHLADYILPHCNSLKVVFPPGMKKDLRGWFNAGGSADTLSALIIETAPLTREVLNEKIRKMTEWREAGHKSWLAKNQQVASQ